MGRGHRWKGGAATVFQLVTYYRPYHLKADGRDKTFKMMRIGQLVLRQDDDVEYYWGLIREEFWYDWFS